MERLASKELYSLYMSKGGNGSYDPEEIRNWLRHQKVFVFVRPIDSWDSWNYTILMEDAMSPFFEPDYDKFNEFKTYEEALEAGLKKALELM